jgi:tetratricopeptide (TPR) repeat protein
MIAARLAEADALYEAGDLKGAADRCQTALDLAGEDIDASRIREKIRQIESPKRGVPASSRLEDAVPSDLLPDPDLERRGGPDEREEARAAAPPVSDAELFGEDPEELFEIHMNTLDPQVAESFRAAGPDFRLGYLALAHGAAGRALELFDRMSWDPLPATELVLEKARALMLAKRSGEGLELLDRVPAETIPGRWLRVELLRDLGRLDEAIEAGHELVRAFPQPNPPAESLLAWTLLEAGRPEEAFDLLEGWLDASEPYEEVLVPAAQAASALGRSEQATALLENLIQYRIQMSLMRGREPDFPVEAGRRLLKLYVDSGKDVETVRTLVMHLLDFDRERGEAYREMLLKLR